MGKYKQLSIIILKETHISCSSRDEDAKNQCRHSFPFQLSLQWCSHSLYTTIKVRIFTGNDGILCNGIGMYVKGPMKLQTFNPKF